MVMSGDGPCGVETGVQVVRGHGPEIEIGHWRLGELGLGLGPENRKLVIGQASDASSHRLKRSNVGQSIH